MEPFNVLRGGEVPLITPSLEPIEMARGPSPPGMRP